jgi:hypothetical protein
MAEGSQEFDRELEGNEDLGPADVAGSGSVSPDTRTETGGVHFNAARAKWPQYANRIERLDTYKSWPKPKIDVEELAEAGMFYKGDNDNTLCFYCGISIGHWETHDNPWIEHARFSQDCQFLNFCKGLAFVKATLEFYEIQSDCTHTELVTHARPNQKISEDQDAQLARSLGQSLAHTQNIVVPWHQRVKRHVEPREIRSRLDMASVKTLIEFGYPRVLVGSIIALHLQLEGDDFDSYCDLVNSVINIAELVGLPLHTSRAHPNSKSDQQGPIQEVCAVASSATTSRPGSNHVMRKRVSKKKCLKGRDLVCKVCKKKEVNVILKNCGHTVLCDDCAKIRQNCPKCHKHIHEKVMLYVA